MCVHVTIEVRYVKIDEKYVAHIELSLKKTLLLQTKLYVPYRKVQRCRIIRVQAKFRIQGRRKFWTSGGSGGAGGG